MIGRFAHRVTQADINTSRHLDPHNCFICRCVTRFVPAGTLVTTDFHTCSIRLPDGKEYVATIPNKVANLLRDFDYSDGILLPNPFDLVLQFDEYTNQERFEYK